VNSFNHWTNVTSPSPTNLLTLTAANQQYHYWYYTIIHIMQLLEQKKYIKNNPIIIHKQQDGQKTMTHVWPVTVAPASAASTPRPLFSRRFRYPCHFERRHSGNFIIELRLHLSQHKLSKHDKVIHKITLHQQSLTWYSMFDCKYQQIIITNICSSIMYNH